MDLILKTALGVFAGLVIHEVYGSSVRRKLNSLTDDFNNGVATGRRVRRALRAV